jgi:hypothetical protein
MCTTGQLTNTRRSDDAPEPDGVLRVVARKQILHYRQLYINRPDPIAFLPSAVDTTGQLHDDFSRLLFPHVNREGSALVNDIPEESNQSIQTNYNCVRIRQQSSAYVRGEPHVRFVISVFYTTTVFHSF